MPQAVRDHEIQDVGDDEVDYELPSANSLTGSHANLIPIPGTVQSTRVFYGARFFNQSLPVVGGEAPLVQSLIDNDEDGRSFDDHYGERSGAIRADDDYEVLEVLKDRMRLLNSRNEVVEKELYDELPFNRKSMITHRSLVKPGDKVARGKTLAASNYTDDNGTLAMGLNARIGIVPFKGYSMDDAVVIRQGFADRLRSQTTETFKQDRDEQSIVGRNHFQALFPDKFTKDQLSLVDDDGVIQPGMTVNPGDPLILTTQPRVLSSTSGELGKLSKTMRQVRRDASQVWEGDGPARIMKVAKTKKGVKVVVLQERGTKDGDKITLRHGQKGTVSLILPDDHMPRTADGEPLDMMLNPQGMPSRANFATLYELLLGKVAKKNGSPMKLPMYLPPGENMYDYVEKQLAGAGLTDVEDVYDPTENRKLENPITVGMGFIQKLHHTSASKADARGQGSYDLNQQPAKGGEGGAKRLSGLETHALMSSGAYATLREGATIRGQKNDDYWRMLRAGHTPRDPDEPFVWKKFRGLMSGAGLRMRDEGKGTNRLGPLTDDDVDAYKPLEVRNGRTLDLRTLEPEKGGLFDQALVGNNMWGKITLPEPVLNPAFEGPARHVLGLKLKDLQAILAGEMDLPEEMQQRIAERLRVMTKAANWTQSLGSAIRQGGRDGFAGILKKHPQLRREYGAVRKSLKEPSPPLTRGERIQLRAGAALGTGAVGGYFWPVGSDDSTTDPPAAAPAPAVEYKSTEVLPVYGIPHKPPPANPYHVERAGWNPPRRMLAEAADLTRANKIPEYVGHYRPADFYPNYGQNLETEVEKARAYMAQNLPNAGQPEQPYPLIQHNNLQRPIPVFRGNGHFMMPGQPNFGPPALVTSISRPDVIPPEHLEDLEAHNMFQPGGSVHGFSVPTDPDTAAHEMAHAWTLSPNDRSAPAEETFDPSIPGSGILLDTLVHASPGAEHGLLYGEQLGWLSRLQHELYGQNGKRLESPDEAKSYLERMTTIPEEEFEAEVGKFDSKDVPRGMRHLRQLLKPVDTAAATENLGDLSDEQLADSYRELFNLLTLGAWDDTPPHPDDLPRIKEMVKQLKEERTRRKYSDENRQKALPAYIEWLSKLAPGLVSNGQPDEDAIKMGSVQPAFYDPEFAKVGNWTQSLGSAVRRGTQSLGRAAKTTPGKAVGSLAGGTALGTTGAMLHEGGAPPVQSNRRIADYDQLFGTPVAVKPFGLRDWFKRPAEYAAHAKQYLGHYTPRQFMGGYGDKLDTEIEKAKTYRAQLRQQQLSEYSEDSYPELDYSKIDEPVPVLLQPGRSSGEAGFFRRPDGSRFVRAPDGTTPISKFDARLNKTTQEELSPPNILAHEMRHAWQTPPYGDYPTPQDSPPIFGEFSGVPETNQPHGLRSSEQMGWLGGLQHELFKQRGSRMETPEEAKELIQKAVTSEQDFLKQYPIENTEVLRGVRWLKSLRQQATDPYKSDVQRMAAQENYERMLEWMSKFAPATVSNGELDEEAIKMGSVKPVFHDPVFEKVAAATYDMPKTGPDAIHLALAAVDLDALEKEQQSLVASGKVSKRNGAVQTLNAISGLRANNVRPEQLMLTKIPVVPPAFRPFALVGETFIPGDANELYKDLFDLKDVLTEAKQTFGDDGAVSERKAYQSAVKALYGYGDPVNPKSQQRGVSGFLRQISGSNPKFSFFQRKLISKTQDQVGRGVITPDPELTLDEIGVPEDMAWEMYGTYIMRRLVRRGMPRAEALRQIKDRSKFAREALEQELPERPVVYSRSPAWHKYNIISGTPRLIKGDTIRISPFVAAGMGADYDGDTVNLHVPASPDAVREARDILRPSSMLFSIKDDEKVVPRLVQEQILGPYAASQRPAKAVHTFPDRNAALKAIRTGAISLSDEIEIPDNPIQAKVAAQLQAMRNLC